MQSIKILKNKTNSKNNYFYYQNLLVYFISIPFLSTKYSKRLDFLELANLPNFIYCNLLIIIFIILYSLLKK